MSDAKLMTLAEAVAKFVPDGSTVAMGTCLEAMIPFAAAHEMIRQQKRELTLVGPISDICFDQLIGGGCVAEVRAAWVGNVITGSAYNFRRTVEDGTLAVEDHSNLTLSAALRAGAWGVPYLPVRTALGSDLFKTNRSLKSTTCPFSGETLAAVAAITPGFRVITTLGVLRFDADTREMVLAALHPGITVETVLENTGWPLRVDSRISVTAAPGKTELRMLRRFDPQGFWTAG